MSTTDALAVSVRVDADVAVDVDVDVDVAVDVGAVDVRVCVGDTNGGNDVRVRVACDACVGVRVPVGRVGESGEGSILRCDADTPRPWTSHRATPS